METLEQTASRIAVEMFLKGCKWDIDLNFVEFARRFEAERSKNAEPVANGCLCSVCGEWQYWTSSGMVCKNGHGGVMGINTKCYLHPPLQTEDMKDAARIVKVDGGFDYPFGKGVCHPTLTLTFVKEDWEARDKFRAPIDAAMNKEKE